MEMNEKMMKLNEEELTNVAGGEIKPPDLRYCKEVRYIPEIELICLLELCDIVEPWYDSDEPTGYYDTKRANGWKTVGAEDMVNYVGRTIGYDNPRYLALVDFCENGECVYNHSRYI